jgi:hypothetical protein
MHPGHTFSVIIITNSITNNQKQKWCKSRSMCTVQTPITFLCVKICWTSNDKNIYYMNTEHASVEMNIISVQMRINYIHVETRFSKSIGSTMSFTSSTNIFPWAPWFISCSETVNWQSKLDSGLSKITCPRSCTYSCNEL